jgi:hypothetical protein
MARRLPLEVIIFPPALKIVFDVQLLVLAELNGTHLFLDVGGQMFQS